jgi:hypothetical protein
VDAPEWLKRAMKSTTVAIPVEEPQETIQEEPLPILETPAQMADFVRSAYYSALYANAALHTSP